MEFGGGGGTQFSIFFFFFKILIKTFPLLHFPHFSPSDSKKLIKIRRDLSSRTQDYLLPVSFSLPSPFNFQSYCFYIYFFLSYFSLKDGRTKI
jgi:hypothetical protein